MGNEPVVHADDLQNSRLEVIFYATLLITVVLAWYVVRDMVLMLPGAGRFFGVGGENTKFASAEMSTVYLVFLTAYTGYKEFRKWFELKTVAGAQDGQIVVPKAQVVRFKRGEVIVFFWALLLIVNLVLLSEGLIARLPKELLRVSMQAIGIWLGTLFSEGALRSRKKANAAEADKTDDHEKQVCEYLDANGVIYNEDCQKLTGLTKYKAYRLLQRLIASGELASDGKKRGKRYFRPDNPPKDTPPISVDIRG